MLKFRLRHAQTLQIKFTQENELVAMVILLSGSPVMQKNINALLWTSIETVYKQNWKPNEIQNPFYLLFIVLNL